MWVARLIVLSFLWKGFLCDDSKYTLNVSTSVRVQSGLCVAIPCTFTHGATTTDKADPTGYWYRAGTQPPDPAAASTATPAIVYNETRGRFKIVGDLLRNECSLRIDDVIESDTRKYYFRYKHSADSKVIWSYVKYPLGVTVLDLTDEPEVTIPDEIIEGQEVTVNCTAPGRCMGTPPTITWGVKLISTYREHLSLIDYNNGTKFNVSSITFNASRKDHGKHLNCTAVFPAVKASTTRQSTLDIQYSPLAPEIRAFISDKDEAEKAHNTSLVFIREGLNSTLLCVAADSNPSSNLTWKKGEKILATAGPSSNNTLALEILTINSSSDGGVYQCQAINRLGEESSLITVNVQYPPRIPNIDIEVVPASDNSGLRKNDSTVYVLEGKTFHVHCAVDSAPIANLTWTYGGDRILKTSVNQNRLTLSLENIARERDGQYWCMANNELGTANTSLHISVEYKPKFAAGYNTSCQRERNNVMCVCVVVANPLPDLRWKINKETLPETVMDGTVNETSVTDHHTKTSTLMMNVNEEKSLSVECHFSNNHGEGSLLMLRAIIDGNTQGPNILPIIGGVLAGVVFMAAVFMLGWLFIRKGRKKKNDNTSASDKQEMMENDSPIYSEIYKVPASLIAVSNGGAENQPSSGRDVTEPTENLYGNLEEDLQYASINFSKLNPRTTPVQLPEETVYSDIKVK